MNNKTEDSLWVRSQNKEELVNCISFSVRKNIGGKKKYAITGAVSNGFWGKSEMMLGLYATKEVALNELNQLQTALVHDTDVYEMN